MLNILTIYDYKNTYYGYRVLVTGGEYICDIYLVYTCTDNGIGQGYIDIYIVLLLDSIGMQGLYYLESIQNLLAKIMCRQIPCRVPCSSIMYEVLNLRYVLYVCTVLYIVRLVDVYSIHRKLFAYYCQAKQWGLCFNG